MCIAFAVCLRLPIPHGFSALPARNGFFLTPVFPSLQNKDATVNCHGIVPNVHDFTIIIIIILYLLHYLVIYHTL